VADKKKASSVPAKKEDTGQIGELVDMVKTYVKQETVGPLQGIGRKIGMGLAGAAMLGMGLLLVGVGLLRLIQDKVPRFTRGAYTWVPYLLVLAVCVVCTVLALWRINKLEKELNS
jgi:hypothetical protein